MSWPLILGLAGGCYLFKIGGLFAARSRRASPWLDRYLGHLPPAVLAGLIVVQTFDGGGTLTIDAGAGGLFVGAAAAWLRAPFALVLVLAAATTAGVRLL